ncbi:DUF2946 domain-containing protein [Affinibrenneria salicis]|uniref:DUF2946 domain-containing protein n=1 Tax=Affinibrenneria salicis TaxID=2590031 RepID=UPI00168AB301|nr:DUF2946 domain-containing protein [Affinibrenneria salicis]
MHRFLPAWLGILAIVMMSIAPGISRALEQAHAEQMMLMPDCESGHSSVAHHPSTADAAPADVSVEAHSHRAADGEHMACGYCLLLIHLPMLSVAAFFVFPALSAPGALSSGYVCRLFVPALPSASQPRAPPAVSR